MRDAAEDTDLAMDQVLRAEQEARAEIGRCEARAANLIEQARHQSRQIAERADGRITALHARCEAAVRLHVAALREADTREAAQDAPLRAQSRWLSAAVQRVAERLTGGAPAVTPPAADPPR